MFSSRPIVTALLRGDLGSSRFTFVPVADDIARRLPATAELVFFSMVVASLWTIPLGVRAAVRPNGPLGKLGEGISQFGVSVPAFWLGLLLLTVLSYQVFPIFPNRGRLTSEIDSSTIVTGLLHGGRIVELAILDWLGKP